MQIQQLYQLYIQHHTVTTDSRTITPGCLFFAFRGQHFDASDFIPQAIQQGAALCITDNPHYLDHDHCLVVDNVLSTLQTLALYHRQQLVIPILAITGTNGKTTTKELTHAVLSQRFKTSATQGNLNNHLGVPLTLLAIPPQAQIAIVEMGANHPGEIDTLCQIAHPTCGLITNVGRAHLEGFGSFEGVINTKTELYRHLASHNGTIFIDADNPHLMPIAQSLPQLQTITYGTTSQASVRGTLLPSDTYLRFYFEHQDNVYTVQTQLLGNYNFANAMAATAVGLHFGVDPFDIKQALEAYTPSNNRSQLRRTASNTLYLDCYNANPTSMAAAIGSFATSNTPNRIAILGSMKELGAASFDEHRHLVQLIQQADLEQTWLIGPEFDGIALPSNCLKFSSTEEVQNHLKQHPLAHKTILIKGSNSNHLWQLENLL